MLSETVAVAVRTSIGLVLITAAAAKLRDLPTFGKTLAALGVPVLRYPIAAGIVTAEGILGLSAISGVYQDVLAPLTAAFIFGLVAVSGATILSGRVISCSCFGRSERSLGRDTLAMSATLLAAEAVYLIIVAAVGVDALPTVRAYPAIVALSFTFLGAYAWSRTFPLLQSLRSQRIALSK